MSPELARPGMLAAWLLLPLVALLVWWAGRSRQRAREELLGPLAARLVSVRPFGSTRVALRLSGLFFLVLALADPRYGRKVEEVTRRGVDVLFLLDVSNSMRAQDVRPSRLHKAKAEIRALAQGLKGDRVGLIAFAGVPDVVCPLTTDLGAFGLFLDLADPEILPVQGTDLGAAIDSGLRALGTSELEYKVLVLFTDGEDHEGRGRKAAAAAAAKGVRIHTVNVGGAGAPVPAAGGFKKDASGQAVFTRPDAEGLAAIASATGGGYYGASAPRIELGPLLEEISTMEDRELHSQEVDDLESRYQFPLAAGLMLLLLELGLEGARPRRSGGRVAGRWLATVLLGLASVLSPSRAGAGEFETALEEGNAALAKGDVETALARYSAAQAADPEAPEATFNLGLALLGARRPEEAAKAFRKAGEAALASGRTPLAARSQYNLGLALAEPGEGADAAAGGPVSGTGPAAGTPGIPGSGPAGGRPGPDLEGALQAFRRAIRLAPEDLDAKYNYLTVERLLEAQKQQQQKQQQDKDAQEGEEGKPGEQGGKPGSSQPRTPPTSPSGDPQPPQQPGQDPSEEEQGESPEDRQGEGQEGEAGDPQSGGQGDASGAQAADRAEDAPDPQAAERMLDALASDERERLKRALRARTASPRTVTHDW